MKYLPSFQELLIRAREEVYTKLIGNHLSKMHGNGYDLSEIREYQIGDDVRKINWNITAKMQKPYIKELQSSRELSIVVVALMDGSLYFDTENTKQMQMTHVAALLGYAAYQKSDRFMGILYQQKETLVTQPTKEIFDIERYIQALYDSKLLGTHIEYHQKIADTSIRVVQKSLIFILGDFLQEVDLSLLVQKHEVIIIIIRDRAEEYPVLLGEVNLQSPQYAKSLESYFGVKSIARYKKNLEKNDRTLREHCLQYNTRLLTIYGDEDASEKLNRFFINS